MPRGRVGEDGLTDQQREFVKYLLADPKLVATDAYRKAFPRSKNDNSINANSARLMAMPKIKALVQAEMDKRADKLDITAERTLQEIAYNAFSDIGNLFDEEGTLKRINHLPRSVRASISSIEVTKTRSRTSREDDWEEEEYVTKIKLWDKTKSLDQLGRHLKLFNDKLEITGKDGAPLIPEQMSELELARRVAFILSRPLESKPAKVTPLLGAVRK